MLDEPTVTMGGLNGSIDTWSPPPERRKPKQEQIDSWRWGALIVTVGWVVFITYVLYSTFGGKP